MRLTNKEYDKLIGEKLGILESADKDYLDQVKIFTKSLFSKVRKIYNKFSVKDGKLSTGSNNQSVLARLKRDLEKVLDESKIGVITERFLSNFDKLEELTEKQILNEFDRIINKKGATKRFLNMKIGKNKADLIDALLKGDRKINTILGSDKVLAKDEILDGILSKSAQKTSIINPLRKIMYRHVTTGVPIDDAIEELRKFVVGDDTLSDIERHVNSIVKESINRFNGAINQRAANEFGFDGFRIIGSLIATSHISCREMVNGNGDIGSLEIKEGINEGLFKMSDIPKIIEINRKRAGFVKGTNPSNYLIVGNHYGDRHDFSPTMLLEDDDN